MQLSELENKIIKCKKCPRLVKFRNKIAKEKRKQYMGENYWGKPLYLVVVLEKNVFKVF